jgi:O-succinylbenzoate synthase
MAKTAVELAVWDCYARQQGVPLRTLLGGDRTEIPVGASLGMNPVPETVASVEKPRRARATGGSS